MSIVVRPPGTHPLRGSRAGDGAMTDIYPLPAPSVGLLHADGDLVPGPAPAPSRTPALDALRGRSPAFVSRVETVRRHLEPIRSRLALSSSFAREASPDSAVCLAYEIRWLELEAKAPRRSAGFARLPQGRRRGASIPTR